LIVGRASPRTPAGIAELATSVRVIQERYFVEAARAIGVSSRMIVRRHLVPNSMAPIMVNASADLGAVILAAGGLAFLGLGAKEPTADRGQQVSAADLASWHFVGRMQRTHGGPAA
jgi:ABC-type dipeptide/oligopeptide/nickel transport system permease subunit